MPLTSTATIYLRLLGGVLINITFSSILNHPCSQIWSNCVCISETISTEQWLTGATQTLSVCTGALGANRHKVVSISREAKYKIFLITNRMWIWHFLKLQFCLNRSFIFRKQRVYLVANFLLYFIKHVRLNTWNNKNFSAKIKKMGQPVHLSSTIKLLLHISRPT